MRVRKSNFFLHDFDDCFNVILRSLQSICPLVGQISANSLERAENLLKRKKGGAATATPPLANQN